MKKEYYTSKEVEKGIEELPPIKETTLRNLRQQKRIRYTKVGKDCLYKKEWIEDYINGNTVEVAS